jgi:hypothetical protein
MLVVPYLALCSSRTVSFYVLGGETVDVKKAWSEARISDVLNRKPRFLSASLFVGAHV